MKKILSIPLACLLLASCSFIPDFHRPEVAAPAGWRNMSEADRQTQVTIDWWREFKSEELNAFMRQALDANTDLRAGVARIEQARASARMTGAALYPDVSASGSISKTETRSGRNGGGTGIVNGLGGSRTVTSDSWRTGLDISYELDLFGGVAASVQAARADVATSVFDQQALSLVVIGDVANAYFQTVNLRERARIARQNLDNARDVLRIVEAQLAAGAVSALEVAQQRTALASTESAVVALEAQQSYAETALAVLTGQQPQAITVRADSLEDIVMPDIDAGQPSTLLQRRPDIAGAEAQLLAADANIGAARAAFYPSVDLGLGLAYAATPISATPTRTLDAASSILAPIFSGGRLEGQLDLNKARRVELAENYRKTVLTSFKEVEDALVEVKAARQRQQYFAEAVDQANESYRLSRELYDAGAVDFQTLLNAQASVLQAEDSYAEVRLEMLSASVDLFKALGGGWQSDGSLPIDAAAAEIPPHRAE